jgi:hypothetical protein
MKPENPQEQQPGEGEQVQEQLLECLEHTPTNFIRGKPQSILSLPVFIKMHLSPFICFMH